MWSLIKALGAAVLAVAVVVGGYYIGIVVAILTGILLIASLAITFLGFLAFAIYDFFQTKKEEQDP